MSVKLPSHIGQQVKKGISILQHDGVVAYPTDTVYGLGASLRSLQAIARVFTIKKRPLDVALPLLLSSIDQVNEVAVNMPEIAQQLARRFWPGALTLVVYKSPVVPDIVTGGCNTVAVRVPSHPVPIALIEGIQSPIVGTSANLSGQPSGLTAGEVTAQLGGSVDLIIDGGSSPGGVESTVVDVTQEPPVILRRGAVSFASLKQIVNNLRGEGE